MEDFETERSFIDDVSTLDHETEDGWCLASHDVAPTRLVLQARTEPGVLESSGLIPGACYSFAIWPRGALASAGRVFRQSDPRHRAIVENGALPNLWYVRYETAGFLDRRMQWTLLGRSRQHVTDPAEFRHRVFERFHRRVRSGSITEAYIHRYVTGPSLGSRLGGAMAESWAWPQLPPQLRHG
ncbi:hypothetical protein ACFU9F_23660 [Streptomyces zhihengii]|uniref:hypothetical protein n=1 Tax=Streptomyces zhihengii TaxID=1818004 RepID=UPI00368F69E2